MQEYLRHIVRRFSRGAPASAFLGPQTVTLYPMTAGYGQQRVFRPVPINGATNEYTRLTFPKVTPAKGRFHSRATPRTSPLIPGMIYGYSPSTYADDTGDS